MAPGLWSFSSGTCGLSGLGNDGFPKPWRGPQSPQRLGPSFKSSQPRNTQPSPDETLTLTLHTPLTVSRFQVLWDWRAVNQGH